MTALSNDPVDRPTAARFRDQLANVPATSISKRGALVGAGEDTSSVFPRGGSLVPGHSAISNSHSIAVTAVTADSQRASGQVAVRRGTTKGRKTPRSHSGPGRSLGYCDRTYDGLADQRARSVGSSCHDNVECDPRRTVVERRSVTSLRPEAADFDHDTEAGDNTGSVRRSRRPFSWRIQPTPPSPSKPFKSKVRIAVGQIPFCGWSAGREAGGWPSRYPPRPTSLASSPPMSSWGSRVNTGFAC